MLSMKAKKIIAGIIAIVMVLVIVMPLLLSAKP